MANLIIIGLLVLTSVVGLAVIIERGLALRARGIIPPAVEAALEGCRAPADWPVLQRICEQNPSPLSRLLLQAGQRRSWPKAENASALETAARQRGGDDGAPAGDSGNRRRRRAVDRPARHDLRVDRTVRRAGRGGAGRNRRPVQSGIALALNATLFGLLAAIPSLAAWSYYNKKVEELRAENGGALRPVPYPAISPRDGRREERRTRLATPLKPCISSATNDARPRRSSSSP